ncbi:MAG: hypothetical protein NZM37_13135, partial [Sandaracinaceae bacterium]|nr:hypothetical protein [Sandaracinaceae bacterium]
RSITSNGQTIPGALEFASWFGIDKDTFFVLIGHGIVPLQLTIALAYALTPLAERFYDCDREKELISELDRWLRKGNRPAVLGGLAFVGALVALVAGSASGMSLLGLSLLLPFGALMAILPLFGKEMWRFLLSGRGVPLWLQTIRALGWVGAISFHIGAEYLALEIGWFSAYMIAAAIVFLSPAPWLSLFGFLLTKPWRTLNIDWGSPARSLYLLLLFLVALSAVVIMGALSDLPGGFEGALLFAGILVAIGVLGAAGKLPKEKAANWSQATLGASLALLVWLEAGSARFDFYRYAGGDFRRRGLREQAILAYEKALEHAPSKERNRIEKRLEELQTEK